MDSLEQNSEQFPSLEKSKAEVIKIAGSSLLPKGMGKDILKVMQTVEVLATTDFITRYIRPSHHYKEGDNSEAYKNSREFADRRSGAADADGIFLKREYVESASGMRYLTDLLLEEISHKIGFRDRRSLISFKENESSLPLSSIEEEFKATVEDMELSGLLDSLKPTLVEEVVVEIDGWAVHFRDKKNNLLRMSSEALSLEETRALLLNTSMQVILMTERSKDSQKSTVDLNALLEESLTYLSNGLPNYENEGKAATFFLELLNYKPTPLNEGSRKEQLARTNDKNERTKLVRQIEDYNRMVIGWNSTKFKDKFTNIIDILRSKDLNTFLSFLIDRGSEKTIEILRNMISSSRSQLES